MQKKQEKKNGQWPMDFLYGDPVMVRGRRARVDEAFIKDVPRGHVPIRFEDRREFICVPADDIDRC